MDHTCGIGRLYRLENQSIQAEARTYRPKLLVIYKITTPHHALRNNGATSSGV